jgi:ligand-binding sensor domain-containing protein/serine phosphatase RsbU (regulator of sigma subunit)
VFSITNPANAQSYQFSKYSVEQGLPQQYIYSLNQDQNGFVWIGTGDGISKFDGIDFQNFTTKDGMAENFVTCSAQRNKNIIWLGHNKGGISRIVDGIIETVVLDTLVDSKITDIVVDQDNYVWATSQNGYLIKISPKLKVKKFDLYFNKKNINSIAGRIDVNLLIGTDEGLFLWTLDSKLEPSSQSEINAYRLKKINCITESKYLKNNFWIGTAESGLYQLKFTEELKSLSRNANNSFNIGTTTINSIEEDENHNLFVSTHFGLFKLFYDTKENGYNKTIHYSSANGISNYINITKVDKEGNTWIGTYGEGLAMLKNEVFTFYNYTDDNSTPSDIRCIFFKDSVQWFGLSNGLLKINSKGEKKIYSLKNGFKDAPVTTILKRGNELLISTDGEGLFRFNTKTEIFTKEYLITSYLANNIHCMALYFNDLWVATEGGLIKKNLSTHQTEYFNTRNGLKHNSIYAIKLLKDGSIVLGSHSNELTVIKDEEISHLMIADLDQLMDIVDIEIDGNNNLWLASQGNGVYKQEADSFIHVSSENGLKSDYCYSIVSDNKNGVWVGHRGGLSRINKDSLSVQVFDVKKGINDDFNKGAVYTDTENNIWFGTNKKAIKFNPKKFFKNTTPPAVSIKNIFISDKKTPLTETITLPYSSYKIKIEFIGISFKQPDGVKYQYFLEGYDLGWSESSLDNTANYPRIEDGNYTFYVKACNNDGFCSEETLAFKIKVTAPFWKKWWFYITMLSALSLLVYYIIKRRERKQKIIQKKLEEELEIRTKEVVKKSKELEEKNDNITDSINYALRIQKSILPSKILMKENFPESFIFYQPRDIVSGDFYWYEKIDNKFIVVCADCTGHGVPGAFMSMIASTLFKEIAYQYEITDPSEFLYKLEYLLKNTLKKSDKSSVHDGLDLSICVFDLDTNFLSFSGAYRPILIYKDKKLERVKTSHFSIGGDDFAEKEFTTFSEQLRKGDIVYLFSDGFPDQFGGDKGKKLYLKGFMSLIENSIDLSMEEQHLLLKLFLKDWKGNKKQIDDILVMGIKIS